MKTYSMHSDSDHHQNLVLVDGDEWEKTFRQFDGSPLKFEWKAIETYVSKDFQLSEPQPRPSSDFPGFTSHVPVFSARAVKALREILEKHGELFPLKCPDGEYYAYNVTCVADALDQTKSEFERSPESGRIIWISKTIFRQKALRGKIIFKVPGLELYEVYVTDDFKVRVQMAGLTGFVFPEIQVI